MKQRKLTLAKKTFILVMLVLLTATAAEIYKHYMTSKFFDSTSEFSEKYLLGHKIQMIQGQIDHAMKHAYTSYVSKRDTTHMTEELSEASRMISDIAFDPLIEPEQKRRLLSMRNSMSDIISENGNKRVTENTLVELEDISMLSAEVYRFSGERIAGRYSALNGSRQRLSWLSMISILTMLSLAGMLLFWVSANFMQRIKKYIKAANSLTLNSAPTPINDTGSDELADLADALDRAGIFAEESRLKETISRAKRSAALKSLAMVRSIIRESTHLPLHDTVSLILEKVESIGGIAYCAAVIMESENQQRVIAGSAIKAQAIQALSNSLDSSDVAGYAVSDGTQFLKPGGGGKVSKWAKDGGLPEVDHLIIVPLGFGRRSHGFLIIGSQKTLEDEPLAIVEASAFCLGFAISDDKVTESTNKAFGDLSVYEAVTDNSVSGSQLDRNLDELLERVVKAMNMDSGAIFVLSDDDRPFLKTHWMKKKSGPAPTDEWELLASSVIGTGKTLVLSDVTDSPFWMPGKNTAGKAVLATPLRLDDQTYGVIQLHNSEAREFRHRDTRLIEILAERLSLAISKTTMRENLNILSQQYNGLFASTGSPVFVLDDAGKVVSANASAQSLSGYSAAEICRMTASELIVRESASRLFLAVDRSIVAAKQSLNMDLKLNGKNGPLKISVRINILTNMGDFLGLQIVGGSDKKTLDSNVELLLAKETDAS